ncbi:MAG: helix-turn-helix domain-containing protein, partial [Ruminococcus bromii]|nr:helix-turn-helix domain-containing protein [Ruminococcus bromii]
LPEWYKFTIVCLNSLLYLLFFFPVIFIPPLFVFYFIILVHFFSIYPLHDRANKDGECWPSVKTIAGDIKLSPATVRRAIKDLKKAGLIETEQRYREQGGKSTLLFRLKQRTDIV